MPRVVFEYLTGLKTPVARQARLTGSWDGSGRNSDDWSVVPMERFVAEDGCVAFRAEVNFDPSAVGSLFRWGVYLDTPREPNVWGIMSEVEDHLRSERTRSFRLGAAGAVERYYLTFCRRMGAQKYKPAGASDPAIRFSVWAPNARKVEVVFGKIDNGYISDDGRGIDPAMPVLQLNKGPGGIWAVDASAVSALKRFRDFDHKAYMFRITKEDEPDDKPSYRTDLYSRCQIGIGKENPKGGRYDKTFAELDGKVSCSVVIDPDVVTRVFKEPRIDETDFVSTDEFWASEFHHARPIPTRIEDMVIYELHVGSLGFGKGRQGKIEDAISDEFLDHLGDLGINTVELLPMAEFSGEASWGYGNSHHFAVECSAGGRDQFKHFVRACHRRGIAVIMDVVYNHYAPDNERAQWGYDSNRPEHNICYWYEGKPSDYPAYEDAARRDPGKNPPGHGGYLDNYSTGYAPRYYEEMVRKHFISSAASMIEDYHVDGFRVDLTNAIHALNVRHGDGRPAGAANTFGAKFLREWARTMKLVRPQTILIAEDHSDWDRVSAPPDDGGLGFESVWYVNFYHHLIGDTGRGSDFAKLLLVAGQGGNEPLAMDYFSGTLEWSRNAKVVYHESHDEAGNSAHSRRTIQTAVNGAPLVGDTRKYAEARCRFVAGMALLSPATPMFLMGESIGAQKDYTYNNFVNQREDILGDRKGSGKDLFRFYQDVIQLRKNRPALRSRNIEILHVHNANRVLVFRRWSSSEDVIVFASLNNTPFSNGYAVEHGSIWGGSSWREIFNSDSAVYGGSNVGNGGATIAAGPGRLEAVIPASGFVVLRRA